MKFTRVFCIVLDGVGVGAAPDASRYGDAGSDSVGNTSRAVGGLRLPNLQRLGLGNLCDIVGVSPEGEPGAHHGVMVPAAAGKDSTSGHWELMGCTLENQLPVYPNGFPDEIMTAFCDATGRGVLGNRAASGTEIIKELGERHVETGDLIVYTSQDSVFQIAAHEAVVPVDLLYRYCEAARSILQSPHGVGRVIARPFQGEPGAFYRTERRRDYSIEPPRDTSLDRLASSGVSVLAIGKIDQLFSGRGIAAAVHTANNRDGMAQTLAAARGSLESAAEFVFTNLVDFDTMWGHRNDARAYALGLEEFDSFLGEFLTTLGGGDLLIVTSDHGNDPTTPGTDHSRERVPLLVWYPGLQHGRNLGTRGTLADVGATVEKNFGVRRKDNAGGNSFLAEI